MEINRGVYYSCQGCKVMLNSISDSYMIAFFKPKGTWKHDTQKVVFCKDCSKDKMHLEFNSSEE